MRVLFIGNMDPTTNSLHHFTAMVRNGYSVQPYDPNFFATRHPLHSLAVRWNKGPLPFTVDKIARNLIEMCRRNHYDVVFVMAENFVHGNTLDEIRRVSPNTVFIYHSLDNNFSPGICKPKDFFHTLSKYDFVFTTKSQNVKKYEELGIRNVNFIPAGYEPTVHCPVQISRLKNFEAKVGFIGTYDRSRDKFVEAVGWDLIRIWGGQWTRYPRYNECKTLITPNPIYFFELSDVIAHTKINLGLLREEAGDRHTTRTFEIPACGGFQLSPRNDEILSFFKEGEEITCFSSLEEMKDKIQYYLKHESEREKIRRRGHEQCLRGGHTYQDRVSTMFGKITQPNTLSRFQLGVER